MRGLDDEDEGPEEFRPPPHPDDRLWRHPAEVAAMIAAQSGEPIAPRPVPAPVAVAPRRRRRRRGMVVAVLVLLVGGAAVAAGAYTARSDTSAIGAATAEVEPVPIRAEAADLAAELISVEDPAEPEVELSEAELALSTSLHADLAGSLPRVEAAAESGMRHGSGFFVTDAGHVVTSAALIEGTDYVLVWTHDGRRLEGEVIGVDLFSDVAVIAAGDGLTEPARLSEEDLEWSDQQVLTIDHDNRSMAFSGLQAIGAAGVDSEFGDSSPRLLIEPGALGGAALVDASGAVVGMVNHHDELAFQATPAWVVERVAAELIAMGGSEHPWLGVVAESSLDGSMARVVQVVPGSPADQAGLKSGDLIDAMGDESLSAAAPLWSALQTHRAGDEVPLAITRHGNRRLVEISLAARPD